MIGSDEDGMSDFSGRKHQHAMSTGGKGSPTAAHMVQAQAAKNFGTMIQKQLS